MTLGKTQLVKGLLLSCISIVVMGVVGDPPRSLNDPWQLIEDAKGLSMLQNWPAAAPLFERAEAFFAAAGQTRDQIYARIGRIRARAEETSQREASRFLSQELTNPLLSADNELRLWCLMAKGAIDFNFDSAMAKQDWLEGLRIATSLGEQQWITRATGELGIVEFLEGNTTLAVNYIGKALSTAYSGGDVGAQIQFLEDAGMGFNEEGRFDESLPVLERVIKIAEQTPGAGFPFLAYQGLGAGLIAQGKLEEGRKVLERALSTARIQRQHGEEGFLLVLLGDACSARGDIGAAKQYFEQAGRAFMSIGFDRGLDEAMLKLAKIDRVEGRLQEAQKALSIASNARPGMELYYRPRIITAFAELRVAQHRLSEANALFEAAEDMREAVWIKLHSRFEMAAMAGGMGETYLEHFRSAVRQGNIPTAFRIMERIRGRASAGLLYSRDSTSKESPVEVELNSKINTVQRTLMETDDAKTRSNLLHTLYQLERELAFADNNQSEILRAHPTVDIASISSVQQILGNDEVILEYAVVDPDAFCIAVSRERVEIINLAAGRARIQDLVDSYLKEVRERKTGSQLAMDLYKLLLDPVLRSFSQSRLIISPDDVTSLLPFEALKDSRSRFLIRFKIVSYVSSASALHALRTAAVEKSAPHPLLAVGDVHYSSVRLPLTTRGQSLQSILRGLETLYWTELPPLPESRSEVLSIAQASTPAASILLDKDATETAFKARAADYRVIHMAVHAISDPEYPYRAGLVLAFDSEDDGLLQVREILRLRVRAELVSLSACETGVGTLQGEAGMTSLVQAFLVAGAKAVVGSLWEVEDRWTAKLMKNFYRHLPYESKAAALRHAKLALLDNGDQAPYAWAGFGIWGEASTVVKLQPN